MSTSYTCLTCHVGFADSELQRQHHKSDWHWYNLKRKVVALPPVTPDEFKKKVLEQKKEGEDVKKEQACGPCKKKFKSQNAYDSHIRSKKHVQLVGCGSAGDEAMPDNDAAVTASFESKPAKIKKVEKEELEEEVEVTEEEWEMEGLAINECLFCCHWSQNMEKNLKHMTGTHSFYIPDIEYLHDLEGFITFLGVKIGSDYECIKCGEEGKEYRSLEAVQKHMIGKGHSIINSEGDGYLEYSDYYDFSKSYDEHVEDAETLVVKSTLAVDDDMSLVLPSGARIGHRSMKIYFKQNLSLNDRIIQNRRARIGLLREYRAIGWGTQATKTVQRDEKRARMMAQNSQLRLQVKANKFQTYFRPQVIF